MRLPGFTAEVGLGQTDGHYGKAGGGAAGLAGGVVPALIAPPLCSTSSCVRVGRCTARVVCCRTLSGPCSCRVMPCYFR